MFKLRVGYVISGIATGCILLFSFIATLPDGKLHIVFCDVGQGDAAYVRFPDGRDMLVDGGPNDRVLNCLGEHMPFWDRHINLVVLTHPQKDHMQGLNPVLERYTVDYFVRSEVGNDTEGYKKLVEVVRSKKISQKFVTSGEHITVGTTNLTVLWPSEEQMAKANSALGLNPASQGSTLSERVLGTSIVGEPSPNAVGLGELNDYSVVLWLRYGSFDALFPGDADTHVEEKYRGTRLAPLRQGSEGQADDRVELLKVPHHGSKTGMTETFLDWLKPQLAVISVGKNSYGHPAEETVRQLRQKDSKILRTDEEGDIELVSDGKGWKMIESTGKKKQEH